VIERAAIIGEAGRLDIERSLGTGAQPARDRSITVEPVVDDGEFLTLDQAMAKHIERAIAKCGGRIDGPRGAAKLLDIHPNTLRSRMTKLGVRLRPA
jgi:hypothetical protein